MRSGINPHSSGGNRVLLFHLDCHKSMGPDEIHRRVLGELVEMKSQAAFHHLSAFLINWRGPGRLQTCQHDSHLQEGS